MSNVNNLHSLLAGKWMITDEYASSLTPYLISILTKGTFPIPENLTKGEAYCFLNSSGEFIGESSTDEEPRIAVLNVKGPILKYSQMCGPMGTIDMEAKMEEWKTQNNIFLYPFRKCSNLHCKPFKNCCFGNRITLVS